MPPCLFPDLLEKSRVTYQLPGVERNYHIFYWLLSGQYPDYAGNLNTFILFEIVTDYIS